MSIETPAWLRRNALHPLPQVARPATLSLNFSSGAAIEIEEVCEKLCYVCHFFLPPNPEFLNNLVSLDQCPPLIVPWLRDILREMLPVLECQAAEIESQEAVVNL